MNPIARPELSPQQRYTLAAAARDADSRKRIRAEAIQRWYSGESRAGAAARANVSPTTIRRWVSDFAETGSVQIGQRSPAQSPTLHAPRGNVVAASTRQFLAALAAELLGARRQRDWSRTQLIAASGVDYSSAVVGHWERGSRAMPIVAFAILCRGLGTDPGEVIRRCYDESFTHVRGLPR
ncbi:helix-turn-helix domain-containing protein [Amycolatopsis sp. NPDC048633]|uniref:helix-turn-helix domain-containing protein n=1 Tax=Amycolatopsis sp. NPDC048633 TaxID=3157095 RepID=UPI00340381D2